MTNKPHNPPAFPCIDNAGENGQTVWRDDGMTLRDYFAAAALTGLVVSNKIDCMNGTQHPDHYASDAYAIADSMLKERAES